MALSYLVGFFFLGSGGICYYLHLTVSGGAPNHGLVVVIIPILKTGSGHIIAGSTLPCVLLWD